jgi:hypothetical protein
VDSKTAPKKTKQRKPSWILNNITVECPLKLQFVTTKNGELQPVPGGNTGSNPVGWSARLFLYQ